MMTVIFKVKPWQTTSLFVFSHISRILIFIIITRMYPTPQEQAIIHEAEKIMIETMARYDPSHDQYHGENGT